MPNIADKPNWMDKITGALVWIASAAVACVVGCIAFVMVKRRGLLISPRTAREAALDRKVLDGEATATEAIAARRGADPAYNRAFQKSRPLPAPEPVAEPPPAT